MRLIEQRRRQRSLFIGIVGERVQHFTGEGFEHLHQHLLLIRQGQIKQGIRVSRARQFGDFARALRSRAKARSAAGVDQFFEGFAQLQTVRPVSLGDSIQHCQGTALYVGTHGISLHTGDATDHARGQDKRL